MGPNRGLRVPPDRGYFVGKFGGMLVRLILTSIENRILPMGSTGLPLGKPRDCVVLFQTPTTKYVVPTPVSPAILRHLSDTQQFSSIRTLSTAWSSCTPHRLGASHKQRPPMTCISAPLTTNSEGFRFDNSLEQLLELRKNDNYYQLIIKNTTQEQPK